MDENIDENALLRAELRAAQRLNTTMHRQMERVLRHVSELEAEIVRLRKLLDPDFEPEPSSASAPNAEEHSDNSEKKPSRPSGQSGRRRPRTRRKKDGEKKKPRRKTLPKNLVRIDDPHPLLCCPCCSSEALSPLPPLVTEKLLYIPARLAVRRTRRDKARCQDCGRISTAQQPPEAVKYGQFDASVLAHLIYRKFGQHLPIERIREDWRRMGHELASSSAQTALKRACELLEPIYDALQRRALGSHVLHCDGTGLDTLLPDQPGKVRGQVRVYCTDGVDPVTLYTFTETKKAKLVRALLRPGKPSGFQGYLVSDFGSEHTGLYDSGDIIQSGCWQHVREYFAKALSSSPRAAQERSVSMTLRQIL